MNKPRRMGVSPLGTPCSTSRTTPIKPSSTAQARAVQGAAMFSRDETTDVLAQVGAEHPAAVERKSRDQVDQHQDEFR